MDIGSYYSESINGFTKNPLLAVPTLVVYTLIQVITYLALFLGFFGLYGSDLFSLSQNPTSALNTPDLGSLWIFTGIMILVLIVTWVLSSFMYAATIGMSKRIVLGDKPELDVAWKKGKKYLLGILGVSIIMVILSIVAFIPFLVGIILLAIYPDNNLSIVGVIIGGLISAILIIALYLFFIFTYQSVVVHKKSIIGSFKESFKLVKKNFFEVIVVLIINALIIGAISIAVAFISAFFGIIPFVGWIIGAILGIIVNTIILPYFTLVLTYFYMDIKDMIPEKY